MNKKLVWRGVILAVVLSLLAFIMLRAPGSAKTEIAGRAVVDAAGRHVTIPLQPARILALGEFDLDTLLALGITPVGATNGRGQTGMPNYLPASAKTIPSVGSFAQPDMDKIIAAQADLIITGVIRDEQILAQLQRIAPTLVTTTAKDDWKTGLTRIAGYLGKDPEATAFLAQYQQRVITLRGQIKPQQTISIVRWNPKGPGYMFKDAFASKVVQDLGLKRPAGQMQPGANHSEPLSLEALSEIDGDWLFIGTLSPAGDAADTLKTVQTSPPFQNLSAVQQQRVRIIDGSLWTSTGGPLAAMALLDDIEKNMR